MVIRMSTVIDFSTIESNILGLKVGRCNNDLFDESSLYSQIVEGGYDLCRLKVPADDEMASYRLNKMGMPFFFSGSIRRYKTRITENPEGNYNFPDLVFEMYNGSQDQLLKDMLIGTWGTYPIGYYRTPYVGNLVTKEREIECVFQYYKKYNLNIDYPNNSIMFIKHGDSYVGFFALNVVNNNLESHIGGILEPYRKSGYFLDKLRYIKEFCVRNNLGHFVFGARNENADVQRIFQFVGFQARGSDNVFHIPGLLTFSQRNPVLKTIRLEKRDFKSIYQQLLAESIMVTQDDLPKCTGNSFQLNFPDGLPTEQFLNLRFSFPVLNNEESLMVVQSVEKSNKPVLGYFRTLNK
jgi:hypothetical protein